MTGHAINAPSATIFPRNEPVSIPAEGSLGFSSKSAASAGSMPIAIAGSESVSKLIKSRCTGANGTGSPASEVYSTARIAAILPDSKTK